MFSRDLHRLDVFPRFIEQCQREKACKCFKHGKTSTSAKREKTWNQVTENGEKENQFLLRA